MKYLIFFLLAYFLYKIFKPILSNLIFGDQNKQKKAGTKERENFQEKHKGKIEDADYEEIE